jgi:hypothetical protein
MISPGGWKDVCKEQDKRPPPKSLSSKTLLEMYVGRRRLQLQYYERTMPAKDYNALYQWVQAWANARPSNG